MGTDVKKKNVLKTLEQELLNADVAAMNVEKNDQFAFDTLTALLTEMGTDNDEMYLEAGFMDTAAEGQEEKFLMYFCNIIMNENIDEMFEQNVRSVAGRLNYYMPNGSFGCDRGTLIYQSSTLLPASLEEESLNKVCRAMIISAMNVAELVGSELIRLSEGKTIVETACIDLIGKIMEASSKPE